MGIPSGTNWITFGEEKKKKKTKNFCSDKSKKKKKLKKDCFYIKTDGGCTLLYDRFIWWYICFTRAFLSFYPKNTGTHTNRGFKVIFMGYFRKYILYRYIKVRRGLNIPHQIAAVRVFCLISIAKDMSGFMVE